MASRKASHKLKSALDERGKRLLRVHRRSIDQREMRREEINRRRQIDDMSPVVESQDASKNPSMEATPVSVNQSVAVARLEKLKRWKEERQLKRKLEAMEKAKSKPGFKVLHVGYKDIHLYQKNKDTVKPASVPVNPVPAVAPKATKARTVVPAPSTSKASTVKSTTKTTNNSTAKTTSTKRTAQAPHTAPHATKKPDSLPATTRTTRSRGAAATKTVSDLPQKKAKQSPPKKSTRSNFMAPTAASRTRAAATIKKAEPPAARGKRKVGPTAGTVKDKGGVSTQRGGEANPAGQQSFAPRDFVFEAPTSVQSFDFKPLSPASAASFLFPQASTNPDTTTMSAFTTRVGRTSTPKRGQPSSSSEENTSDELKRSGDNEPALGSGRGSLSKLKSSCPTLDGSPSLAGKTPARERLGSGLVGDSGVEVNTVATDSLNMKTLSQNYAVSAASSEEDLHTSEQKSSPGKSRKGRRHQKSVSKALDTEYISEQEKGTNVSEAEGVVAEEAALQSRKGKRKSKRVTIQEDLTMGAENSKVEMPAAKQRRKSCRSTIKSESAIELESENMQESLVEMCVSPQSSLSEKTTKEQETPRKSRRSRRSTTSKSKDEQEQEVTTRKSRRSHVPSADQREDSETADGEDLALVEEDTEQANICSQPLRSRRSVAKQQEGPAETKEVTPSKEKPGTSTKMEIDEETVHTQMEIPEPSTPGNGHNLRSVRSKDDMFLTPRPPMSSQKRSAAKRRRRTATMIALSSAKSPEEAIKIIATSPMVEMTRRTPKTKISPELRNRSTLDRLVFDESDFALAPLQLSSAFSAMSTDATNMDDATTSVNVETAGSSLFAGSTFSEVQESCNNDDGKEKRDVTPFREQLSAEIQKLTELSKHWTAITENNKNIPEEGVCVSGEGQVRTTVCQAQLLMDRKGKFHQFAGLLDKCQAGDPATTCQDLQGFWDMIFLQAEDIYSKFEQLEKLQQNNWQPDLSAEQAASESAKKKKPVTSGSKKQKPVGKSKFAAFRAQMMKQLKAPETDDTAVSDVPEEKVFDAGFFKVNSPVRSPSYHCEAGTPSKRISSTASASVKDPSGTPTTSRSVGEAGLATPTGSPQTAEDKENVAQVFLRRSMGATSGRRSYLPVVPSPLLKDGTPAAHSPPLSPSKATNAADTSSLQEAQAVQGMDKADTPVRPRRSLAGRRSTCGRKSVSFLEKSEGGDDDVQQDEGVDMIMMPYLQPSTSQSSSPLMESVLEEGSPFSTEDILKHMSVAPMSVSQGRQQKCLKSLPSSERRRSRRSVSFAACTNTPQPAFALPSTPYNRNSLLAGKRVTRRSTAGSGHDEQSALSEFQELSATPPARRSARPSLLYTPPQVDSSKPKAPVREVAVATLISLSPPDQ